MSPETYAFATQRFRTRVTPWNPDELRHPTTRPSDEPVAWVLPQCLMPPETNACAAQRFLDRLTPLNPDELLYPTNPDELLRPHPSDERVARVLPSPSRFLLLNPDALLHPATRPSDERVARV